jgi:hypothetical protein
LQSGQMPANAAGFAAFWIAALRPMGGEVKRRQ